MSNPQPIDKESLSDIDNGDDNQYIKACNVRDDAGLWKVGDKYYPIEDMDGDFLRTAYYHALSKLGEHAEEILRSQKAVRKFLKKMEEIENEAQEREIEEMIPVSPKTALKQVLDPSHQTNNNQQEVNA